MLTNPRMSRLFNPESSRCLDVAVDHGFFGESTFLAGIESMPAAIATLVAAAPDAIQLSPGQARLLQGTPVRPRPALVLRTDIANIYGADIPEMLFSELIADAVGQAVRLDAACVVVNLLDIAGRPELHRACVRNVTALRAACDEVAMPLMVEPLAMNPADGPYAGDGSLDRIRPLVRQAVELGADIVKADPTDVADDYHLVVEVCGPVPILVRGGGKVSGETLFKRTVQLLEQGASGIVYGRNIVQHATPGLMTQSLMGILHLGWSVEEAVNHLGEEQ